MEVSTIKVKLLETGESIVINKTDFDDTKHKLLREQIDDEPAADTDADEKPKSKKK